MTKFQSALILMIEAVITATLLTACQERKPHTDEIPYDRRNAKLHVIRLDTAAQLTARYRQGKTELLRELRSPDFLEKSFSIPDAEMFNRDAIALLLNQKGAKGMRIYLGQDGKGLIRMVLVAVDADGDDITGKPELTTNRSYAARSSSSAVVLEAGQRCPTMCSTKGPLK